MEHAVGRTARAFAAKRPIVVRPGALRLNGLGGGARIRLAIHSGSAPGHVHEIFRPKSWCTWGLCDDRARTPPSHPCAALHESSPRSTTAARLAAKPRIGKRALGGYNIIRAVFGRPRRDSLVQPSGYPRPPGISYEDPGP